MKEIECSLKSGTILLPEQDLLFWWWSNRPRKTTRGLQNDGREWKAALQMRFFPSTVFLGAQHCMQYIRFQAPFTTKTLEAKIETGRFDTFRADWLQDDGARYSEKKISSETTTGFSLSDLPGHNRHGCTSLPSASCTAFYAGWCIFEAIRLPVKVSETRRGAIR